MVIHQAFYQELLNVSQYVNYLWYLPKLSKKCNTNIFYLRLGEIKKDCQNERIGSFFRY